MKRLISTVIAISAIISAVSCGSKPKDTESSAHVIEEVALTSFKSADINMGGDFKDIINTDKRGAFCLIFGTDEKGDYCGYMTNTQFEEKTSFTVSAKDCGDAKCAAIMSGGKVAVLSVLGNHTYIYTYTKDLMPENTYDLGVLFESDDVSGQLLCADDGFYIDVFGQDLVFVDKEGNLKGNVNVGGRFICGIVNDIDGTPCALLAEGIDTSLVTLEGGNIGEEVKCGELANFTHAICRGEGEYRIGAVVPNGFYGLKEGKWQKITDFTDNDFQTTDIWDMEMCADGELFIMLRKFDGSCSMRYLSQRDISEIKQKKIIKMANTIGTNTDLYTDLIKRFNADNDEYKIEIIDYSDPYSSEWVDPFVQLRLDIVSDNCPDIICFGSDMPVESFGARESIFVDLYEYMDSDPDVSRDDFLDGFLEGLETNGKLLQLCPAFMINTFMIKDKFADGLTSWDFDDFERIVKNMPEGMVLDWECRFNERAQLFDRFINYSQFIDMENSTCSFDSPEFIRALKFFSEQEIGLSQKDYTPGGYGGGNLYSGFRNDKDLVLRPHIFGLYNVKDCLQAYSDEPVTFIGIVGDDRITAMSGHDRTYGIMANSPYKDGAWEFLKSYLFDEMSVHELGLDGIPGIKKYYEKDLEALCTPVSYIDPETGEETSQEYFYYSVDGETVRIPEHPMTEEEVARCNELVMTALKNPTPSTISVWDIVYEELLAYFEGEKTAEQTAEIIQNRVSLYLSEQS